MVDVTFWRAGASLENRELRAGLPAVWNLFFLIFSARLKPCPFKHVELMARL